MGRAPRAAHRSTSRGRITVDLAGPRREINRAQVSALLRRSNRSSVPSSAPDSTRNDVQDGQRADDAYGLQPRPVAPEMILRSFRDVSSANHVRIVGWKNSQGNSRFRRAGQRPSNPDGRSGTRALQRCVLASCRRCRRRQSEVHALRAPGGFAGWRHRRWRGTPHPPPRQDPSLRRHTRLRRGDESSCPPPVVTAAPSSTR